MGLYASDLDRIGVLSFDAWRASRLVVDTGMHALGWTRDRAVQFMLDHTALAPNNIENEVDRYIAWPGQALAYKIGQLELLRLRDEARSTLGPAFDIRAFHDAVLGNGALALPTLRSVVADWATTVRGPRCPADPRRAILWPPIRCRQPEVPMAADHPCPTRARPTPASGTATP